MLGVVVQENSQVFKTLKEESEAMCEALNRLMQPEIDAKIDKITAEKDAEIAEKDAEIARMSAEKVRMKAEKN